MAGNRSEEGKFRPAGYSALVERNGLDAIPNWHISYVAYSNTRVTERMGEAIEEVYPSTYWPGDSTGDHLEFALKYDGTNLAILTALLKSSASHRVPRGSNGLSRCCNMPGKRITARKSVLSNYRIASSMNDSGRRTTGTHRITSVKPSPGGRSVFTTSVHDRSKRAMQDILDMPDRKIDLFIRFCLQNNGRISPRKRAAHFDMLSDHEITELERVVRSAYEISP